MHVTSPSGSSHTIYFQLFRRITKPFRLIGEGLKWKKMEISQYYDSIAIEAFRKGIKRDIGLFIELTKTTL